MAAAGQAAERIRALARHWENVSVVFATGASQLATLRALVNVPDVPWEQVIGFHMDEYIGIAAGDPASFRNYLRRELIQRVSFRAFHEIDGEAPDRAQVCAAYAELLRAHSPQLCLLGIGESGHLAFNDPAEANFDDPQDCKVVALDHTCRSQQVAEGWFASLAEVPRHAITLTIPALIRIPELIASVPGKRKRTIVHRTLHEPIATACPATILRAHPKSHLFVDAASYPPESGGDGPVLSALRDE